VTFLNTIKDNLEKVNDTLIEGVTLIAVSKTKPLEAIMEAYNSGIRDFGENKVQELEAKYEALPKDIRWHLIGGRFSGRHILSSHLTGKLWHLKSTKEQKKRTSLWIR